MYFYNIIATANSMETQVSACYNKAHRIERTSKAWKLSIATVTAKQPLGVDFMDNMAFMAVQGAPQTHTSRFSFSRACCT